MKTYPRYFEPMFAIGPDRVPFKVATQGEAELLASIALRTLGLYVLYYVDTLEEAGRVNSWSAGMDLSWKGDPQGYESPSPRLRPYNLHRIDNDINGNARWVMHWTEMLHPQGPNERGMVAYAQACKLANQIGGRKYRSKAHGDSIVFQASGGISELTKHLDRIIQESYKPTDTEE